MAGSQSHLYGIMRIGLMILAVVLTVAHATAQVPRQTANSSASNTQHQKQSGNNSNHPTQSPTLVTGEDQNGDNLQTRSHEESEHLQIPAVNITNSASVPESWTWHDKVGWFGNILLLLVAGQTLKWFIIQTKATGQSARAAEDAATALVNAEKGWILAELDWCDSPIFHIKIGEEQTSVNVKVSCKNEGKSPVWIEHVCARADIGPSGAATREYTRPECGNFGPMPPLGMGKEGSKCLFLDCDGIAGEGQFISIFVLIEYRDIFCKDPAKPPRTTTLGYSAVATDYLVRQDGVPYRNQNA
jgi:hypothetical protein